jgi:DNA (cytosine-5)-methyltransferase 1
MIHIDLFSGIGGFSLGLKMAGIEFERTYYSDIDKYANMVYAKNFPDAIPLGDVTKVDGKQFAGQDVMITGGFPCQDISQAGRQA